MFVCLCTRTRLWFHSAFWHSGFFYLFQWEQTNTSPVKSEPSKIDRKFNFIYLFFSCIFHYLCTICCVINFINNLIFFPSVLPSEFWREALPRALKACFGPRFFSVKLQLLATLLGLASAPSSGPGDWAFPLVTGALEGLGNTLSFRLAFRLRGGRQPQREFNPFNGPCGSVSRM